MVYKNNYLIYIAVLLFPGLIATTHSGGAVYALFLLAGLFLGWNAWSSLERWEKKVLIGFIVFFLLVSLSVVNTQDMSNGVKRLGRFIHFPLLIPMYLLLKKYQIETGRYFLLGVLLAPIFMFGQAYYQSVILGLDRAIGATNPIMLGDIAMLFAVIISCALLTVATKWQHYLLGAVSIVLAVAASILTIAKGAWLLVPVTIVWFMWIKRKSIGRVTLISILIAGVLGVVGLANVEKVKNRVNAAVTEYQLHSQDPTLNNTSSIGPRIEMWRDSLTIWKKNPILGTGLGDYGKDRLELYNTGKSNLEVGYSHAHSIYFELLSTAGLVGLIAMVVLLQILPFQMFYSLWLKEHDEWARFYALAGMTTIIAFAIFGLTEAWIVRNGFVRTYLMCILVFMSGIGVIHGKESSK